MILNLNRHLIHWYFDPLKRIGYRIDLGNSPIIGKVDAILVLPNGKLEGGADPRGDDKAVGF